MSGSGFPREQRPRREFKVLYLASVNSEQQNRCKGNLTGKMALTAGETARMSEPAEGCSSPASPDWGGLRAV